MKKPLLVYLYPSTEKGKNRLIMTEVTKHHMTMNKNLENNFVSSDYHFAGKEVFVEELNDEDEIISIIQKRFSKKSQKL